MQSKRVAPWLAAVLAALAIGVPSTSFAATTRYGGYMCEPWIFGSGAQGYTGSWTRGNSSIRWTGTTTSSPTLVCPILRHNVANTNGLSDLDMTVYDVNATYDISCSAYIVETSGTVQSTLDFSTQTSSGSSGRQVLNWGTTLQGGSTTSAYVITCFDPYNVEIWSYDVVEP